MFAGKTTALIREAERLRGEGRPPLVIKPRVDDRYAAHQIVSHDGSRFDAVNAADAAHAGELLAGHSGVLIDEAHMFGEPLAAVVLEAVSAGGDVVVCGLDRDHLGGYFEPVASLMIHSDSVERLFAPCAVCGGPGVHSQRLGDSTERIQVGGASEYEARCEVHFEPPVPEIVVPRGVPVSRSAR